MYKEVVVSTLNPKAVSLGELYGSVGDHVKSLLDKFL